MTANELIELQAELTRKKIELVELEMRAEKERYLPHRREFTKVLRAPDDSCWICMPYHGDATDMITKHPVGYGATPDEAQRDFNRAWYANR